VPFEKLLDELRPARDLSRTPLFQVFFNLLNLPQVKVDLPGLVLEAVPAPAMGAKFDLTLYVAEHDGRIGFQWVYNADLFDAARIEVLAGQLESLLGQVVAAPERSIDGYALRLEADAAILPDPAEPLVAEWQGSVVERFAAHARTSPERLAVLDVERVWTYGQLDAASCRLADHLRAHGIGKGDVVAIYARRCGGLVQAMLATWRAGAAFVVLDAAYPSARAAACLDQAQPQALIELASLPPVLEQALAGLPLRCRVAVDADKELEIQGGPLSSFDTANDPNDLAYVAFTSGSTGRPKGILGNHQPVSHFLAWHVETFDLKREDRFSLLAGLSHDPLLRDVFTPLWLGAALCIPGPEEMREPGRLLAWLAEQKVTAVHLTPALGQLLDSAAPETRSGTDPALPLLRWAFFGGGTLTGRDVVRLRRLAPQAGAVNFYGATETPQAMAWHAVDGDPGEGTVPLGRGIDGAQILVLSRGGALAGRGERGEICVRTPYLACDYLGDPAATAERFVVNPFTRKESDRIYRTGDLGRYRLDGSAEFLGRADDQVNVRGFRIELGEVQAALARCPAVRDSVVVAHEENGESRLIAYVVLAGGTGVEAAGVTELRDFLRQRLPEPMVPSGFVMLESLPLTPNGKVDRRALPLPGAERPDLKSPFVEPGSDLERAIADIWRQVLRLDQVGLYDNFFELGGNSLTIAQVRVHLRERLGQDLALVELFRFSTVATLAGHLGQEGPAPSFAKVEERVQRGKLALQRRQRGVKARKTG